MGVVYLARERASARPVAIKLLDARHAADAEATRRFTREARTAASLRHPRIVRTLAIEELAGDAIAIVSEYVPGTTLRTLLRQRAPLPFDRAAALLRDVASALAHAHRFRIVHRDVKPENIFVEASHGHALLADFGIARKLDRTLDVDSFVTSTETAFGTPAYMAPEQIAAQEVDERADVFSLGLVGWEMLTGVRPWEGETLYSILHKQQHEQLPALAELIPEIPVYLMVAIEGAIAKRREARWRNGEDFLSRLSPSPLSIPARLARRGDSSDAWTIPVALPSSSEAMSDEAVDDTPTEERAPAGFEATAHTPELGGESIVAGGNLTGEEDERPPAGRTDSTTSDDSSLQDEASRDLEVTAQATEAAVDRARRHRWLIAAGIASVLAVGISVAPRPRVAAANRAPAAAAPTVREARGDVAAGRASPAASDIPLAERAERSDSIMRDTMTRDTVGGALLASRGDSATSSATRAAVADSGTVASRAIDSPEPAPVGKAPAARRSTTARRSSPARTSRGRAAVPSTVALRDPRCRSTRDRDQRACLFGHIQYADAGLNRTYQTLIARLRARAGGAAEPRAVRLLRAEQRAWLAKRDAACQRGARAASTPLWGLARAPCFAAQSRAREAVLRSRLAAARRGR